jgi:hypothetical protein
LNRQPHRLFGLGVWSDSPLAPLDVLPTAARTDVRIWLASAPRWLVDLDLAAEGPVWYVSPHLDAAGRPLLTASFVGDGYICLRYREGTEFFLDRRGTEIAARLPDSLTVEDVTSYVLGPVLGFLLRLRGTTCLHASAVAIGERAVVFVGAEGAGKSTLAGAMAMRGVPVLSDDVVPIERRGDAFLVHPGWAWVRLWPHAVRAVADLGPAAHWQAALATERRYNLDLLEHGYRFHHDPLPLGAIYLLRTDARPVTELGLAPVGALDAVMSLVANTFAARLLDPPARALEFDVLTALVGAVPVRRVLNGGSVDRLAELCDAIDEDVARIVGTDGRHSSKVEHASSAVQRSFGTHPLPSPRQ